MLSSPQRRCGRRHTEVDINVPTEIKRRERERERIFRQNKTEVLLTIKKKAHNGDEWPSRNDWTQHLEKLLNENKTSVWKPKFLYLPLNLPPLTKIDKNIK